MKSIKTVDEEGIIRFKNEKGEFHRTDGPAIEYNNGFKAWFINGLRHRIDGPAIVYNKNSLFYGDIEYYLNGKKYSEEEYEQEVLKLKLMRLKDL